MNTFKNKPYICIKKRLPRTHTIHTHTPHPSYNPFIRQGYWNVPSIVDAKSDFAFNLSFAAI